MLRLWEKFSYRLRALLTPRFVEGRLLKKELDGLTLILGGHIFFQTLSAAVQLELFTLLSQHPCMTRAQIAARLGIADQPARILLLGCTALGLLRKVGDTYSNSRSAQRFLIKDVPGNLIAIVKWQHHINYKAMYAFYDAIKANRNVGLDEFDGHEPTLYGRLGHHPVQEKIFQNAMEAISVQANALLAEFLDLSHVKYLVDVGGGNGSNIMTLARKYSTLRASVFDSPSVCHIAHENIKAAGLADRLTAVAGDCFQDEFPKGADCILFAHFFTIWSESKNKMLLRKCYDALPAGGSVIVFNMMQWDDGTGPLVAALGSPYFLTLATGEGMLYTWSEYVAWMKETGFRSVTKHVLPRDHGAIVGRKM